MHTFATVATVLGVVVAVSAQFGHPGSISPVETRPGHVGPVEIHEGRISVPGYDSQAQPRPAHATPRSYGSDAASSRQSAAPPEPKPTPVAILKQINRHNEDGSYTYGFEGGDGSFKIETKLPNGEVKGKYGFVDDTGKVRVVEYGANQYGFQPAGEGITVAPPTLVDETTSKEALLENQQYAYQQQQQQQQAQLRAAPQRQAHQPVQAPRPEPQYEQSYRAPQSHTQAVYPPQPVQKPAIFAPSSQQRQSQLLQPAYDEPAPASQIYNQGPAQFSPAPVQEHRSQPHTRQSQGGGILDQLARDYALPQNVAPPLHDISFGYY